MSNYYNNIDKTSREKGRILEIICILFLSVYKELGGKNKQYIGTINDVSKIGGYQKIDSDIRIYNENGVWLIEVKNDSIIHRSLNVVYELFTQIKFIDVKKYYGKTIRYVLEDNPKLRESNPGWSEKTKSDVIFYFATEENPKGSNKFKPLGLYFISTQEFQNFVRDKVRIGIKDGSNKSAFLHCTPHEKEGYNLNALIPIEWLIKENIAHECPQHVFDEFLYKFPFLNEYNSIQELEVKVKKNFETLGICL